MEGKEKEGSGVVNGENLGDDRHSTREKQNQTAKHKDANSTVIAKMRTLEALSNSLGNITEACLAAGTGRATYYEWLSRDPEFKKKAEDVDEIALDFVESKLFETIKGFKIGKVNAQGELAIYDTGPDVRSITFYLKTRGKKRGYVERIETELKNPGEFSPNIVFTKTDEK